MVSIRNWSGVIVGVLNKFTYAKILVIKIFPMVICRYLDLLLSSYATSDNNYAASMKQKRNDHTTFVSVDSDILNSMLLGLRLTITRHAKLIPTSWMIFHILQLCVLITVDNFVPQNEGSKLTPSQKEALIAKRRSY
jgi:hypothetical protein